MADMSNVTAQMAGIIPPTVMAGVAIKVTQSVFGGNPMASGRRSRKGTRKTSRRRQRYNSFGGTSPL